jgi:hypothetical protein
VPDAKRCGTAPLPPNTTPGLTSITEFEFRKAEDAGKRPLVFLLDPKASWPAPHIDALTGEGEQGACILRLRNELAAATLVGFFATPEDLARQVAAAPTEGRSVTGCSGSACISRRVSQRP